MSMSHSQAIILAAFAQRGNSGMRVALLVAATLSIPLQCLAGSPARSAKRERIDKDIAYQLAVHAANGLAEGAKDPEGLVLLQAAGKINPRSKTYLLTHGLVERGLKPDTVTPKVAISRLLSVMVERADVLRGQRARKGGEAGLAELCALYYALAHHFQPKNRRAILGLKEMKSYGVETDLGTILGAEVRAAGEVTHPIKKRASLYLPLDEDNIVALPRSGVKLEWEGPPAVFEEGRQGQAWKCVSDGSSSRMLTLSGKDLLSHEQGTVCFWFCPVAEFGADRRYCFLWTDSSNQPRHGLFMYVERGAEFGFGDKTGIPGTAFDFQKTARRAGWPKPQWYHVALSWEKDGKPALQLNAEPVEPFEDWSVWLDVDASQVRIGSVPPNHRFDGRNGCADSLIDELLVFRKPLTDREIRKLYREGAR